MKRFCIIIINRTPVIANNSPPVKGVFSACRRAAWMRCIGGSVRTIMPSGGILDGWRVMVMDVTSVQLEDTARNQQ